MSHVVMDFSGNAVSLAQGCNVDLVVLILQYSAVCLPQGKLLLDTVIPEQMDLFG